MVEMKDLSKEVISVSFYDDKTGEDLGTFSNNVVVPSGHEFTISWDTSGTFTLMGNTFVARTPSKLPYGTLLRAKEGPFLGQEAMVIGGSKIIIGGVGEPLIVDDWNPDNWEEVDE